MPKPNILYIHSHDTGRYIQPYGHAISTPRLQALAEAGVLFRQAFCQAPTCSPSRAALLTGQCAHSSGMLGLAHLGWKLHDYEQHLLHTLRGAAGYESVLCGIQHIARGLGDQEQDAAVVGYDRVFPRQNAEQHAVAFLDEAGRDRPFYMEVGFFETHRYNQTDNGVFNPDGRSGDTRFMRPPAPLPDAPEVRADIADYALAARRLDDKIALVLDAMERNRLADDTLVIFTTDHGIAFPGMKCSLSDHGLGVSLIMRGPGEFAGGKVVDAMVSQIDVFPTLCEWLEIEPPAWLQGRSMMPLLRGETEEINQQIFGEVTWHATHEPKRALRTQRWKYIRCCDGLSDEARRPVLKNCDASPSKDLWLQHGWAEHRVEDEQLFDLMFDPNETCNLAGDAAHAAILDEMRARLDTWMRDTDDPLLRGPVAPPPGFEA